MKSPNLTLIVLAYNEEQGLVDYIHTCLTYLDSLSGRHEVVIVNDGSSDDTGRLADELSREDPRVRVVHHDTNRGMGAGMRSGIKAAEGDYFTILAADGQVRPDELGKLLPRLQDAPIVLSVYRLRNDGLHRKVLSTGLRVMIRLMLGTSFQLEGIYLFPTVVARSEIGLDLIRSDTFFFSFELVCRAIEAGYSYTTVAIESLPRTHGSSKVANLNRIRRVGSELVKFRVRRSLESL